jgi:hypothetical protein
MSNKKIYYPHSAPIFHSYHTGKYEPNVLFYDPKTAIPNKRAAERERDNFMKKTNIQINV